MAAGLSSGDGCESQSDVGEDEGRVDGRGGAVEVFAESLRSAIRVDRNKG